MTALMTVTEACAALPSKPTERWLNDFLRKTKTDPQGRPLYRIAARAKLVYLDRLIEALKIAAADDEETREAAKGNQGFVYFIGCGDFIKIGYSRSLPARLHQLRTSAPEVLELLHIERGTFKIEKVFHREFASIRSRGEWFRKTPELLAFIEQRKQIKGTA